jgi:hypothetical protein
MYIVFEFLRRIGGTLVMRGCLKCGRSWAEALVRSDQIKDYTIDISCYSSPQHTAIMNSNKDGWSDMHTRCFNRL